MAYKNGKTYLTKKIAETRKAIRTKNIEALLWIILSECFEDLEANATPRYGKTMLTFVIQQLAVIENKKSFRGKTGAAIDATHTKAEDIINKWLAIKAGEDIEDEIADD